ncbi:hypothetical protein M514_20080 [Trichuris suis]|uniref:Uncharacterized protein n=1 Tax=Trichuris suis TaxID=68888 RepID=A0A085NE84_9BILA|nr:hypothetical protein M514_20075 [Trichuris suis]KFD67785.1 hypothetical protein M514_20080 [Trichuris suis]KHJ41226.1 hypothetical protein D918_08676 [Trichuris suis]
MAPKRRSCGRSCCHRSVPSLYFCGRTREPSASSSRHRRSPGIFVPAVSWRIYSSFGSLSRSLDRLYQRLRSYIRRVADYWIAVFVDNISIFYLPLALVDNIISGALPPDTAAVPKLSGVGVVSKLGAIYIACNKCLKFRWSNLLLVRIHVGALSLREAWTSMTVNPVF